MHPKSIYEWSYYRLGENVARPLVKISARSINIWGSKAQPPPSPPRLSPKKEPIHDAELISKTLKILEFTTTYAILMKLSSQICILITSFHWQNLGT